jgi:hypothetical protein
MLSWLLLSTLAAGQEIEVSVRAGKGDAVACAVRNAEGAAAADRLTRAPAGGWLWRRTRGDVLTCSSPGFEPMDIEAGQAGLPARIQRELWPARTVTLLGEGPAFDAVVEWRGIGEAATWVIARRRVRLHDALDLPVAGADRLLRVVPSGLSPISLFVPAGKSSLALRVPRPRPGGEVFGILPPHVFVPAALELRAPGFQQEIEPDARRVFQASSLAPGTYTLVPRFRGGLRGRSHTVVVRAGQTAELVPLALPAAGAVSLVAASETCVPQYFPARLWLRRLSPEGAVEPLPIADLPVPPCERNVEGLEAGTYEASLRGAGGKEVVAVARFTVPAGQTASCRLKAAEVRVTGRLTLGKDHPAAGITLSFESDGKTWTAPSDENGEYRAALGAAGAYSVSIPPLADLVGTSFTRRFHAGDQTADFELGAGAILVRATRGDAAPLGEEVLLALTSQTGRRISASWNAGQEREKRFLGLETGEYWVTGSTTSGLVSQDAVRVSLTAEQPLAEVDLELGRHEGLLEVVDEAGAPVVGAQVESREALVAANGPGTFPLQQTPMGEWLKVRASGYLSTCQILQADDLPTMRVVLRRISESVTLYLDPHLPWDAGLLQAPGADCPVAISDLEYEAQPEATQTTMKIRLPRGRYQMAVGTITRSVDVPGVEVRFSGAAPR